MKKNTVYMMTSCSLMAAVMCVLAPISINIGVVPVTLATLVLYLMVWLQDTKCSLISTAIYLLLGAAGLPVFANFKGGFGVIAGPTGGYIVGFIFLVLISSVILRRFNEKIVPGVIGMIAGTLVLYIFGTVWFIIQTENDIMTSLGLCVFPFIGFDMAKIIIATLIGKPMREALKNPI